MNKFLTMTRAVEPTTPLDKKPMKAGTSKAVGRVARREKEARKASAFLERWILNSGVRKVSEPEPRSRDADGWTQKERMENR